MYAIFLVVSKVVMSSSNLIVVQALHNNEGHSMVAAPILQDCRVMLREFGKVVVEHCIRESNMVAHELAHYGSANNPTLWVETLSVFLLKF